MTGAQCLLQTLVNGGVEICFTNPGTSEMHFIAALDRVHGMRAVLGLFEGVCTGAADGYAGWSESRPPPSCTWGQGSATDSRICTTPGARTPAGQSRGRPRHLPSAARSSAGHRHRIHRPGFSGWVRRSRSAADVPADASDAIAAAMTPPGRVATLILPADCSWEVSREPAPAPAKPRPRPVAPDRIREIADLLRRREPTVVLLSGALCLEEGLRLAGRIARATGARMMGNRVNSRTQRGAGRVVIERLPYPIEPSLAMLRGTAHLILVGSPVPVPFFAWPGKPNWIVPEECRTHVLATPMRIA